MSSSTRLDVHVLTVEGRRRLEQRLDRAIDELGLLDARIKSGEATDDDFAARIRQQEQILEWRRVLHAAADVADVAEDPSIVEVGDEVDIEDGDGQLVTYAVVDPAEADADGHQVSATSPLGRALLGARRGEVVLVDAPGGSYTCVVRGRRRLT